MINSLVGRKPYVIPPRPEVFIQLSKLLASPETHIHEIVEVIRQDPSLYATALATANSPAFSAGRQTNSLNQAVMRLGLQKLHSIVRIAALKNALSKTGSIERFWDTATEVAELTARLAVQLSKESPDEAYSLGMLHDCGIPLMMETFPDYREFLQGICQSDLATLHKTEAQQYGIDHFRLGAEIADRWKMPANVCAAIRWQPDFTQRLCDDTQGNESAKMLLCCLLLAKDISATYRRFWRINDNQPETLSLKPVLEYIGLPDIDYFDIRDDHLAALEQIR